MRPSAGLVRSAVQEHGARDRWAISGEGKKPFTPLPVSNPVA